MEVKTQVSSTWMPAHVAMLSGRRVHKVASIDLASKNCRESGLYSCVEAAKG
jgi:hypothetical protein